MNPSEFERHTRGDNRRFHVRVMTVCLKCGEQYQVYGVGLEHIAMCKTSELAQMVTNALEEAADEAQTA